AWVTTGSALVERKISASSPKPDICTLTSTRPSPSAAGGGTVARSCPAATIEPARVGPLLVPGCTVLRHGRARLPSRSDLNERIAHRGQRKRAGQSNRHRIACRYRFRDRFHGRTSCSSVFEVVRPAREPAASERLAAKPRRLRGDLILLYQPSVLYQTLRGYP